MGKAQHFMMISPNPDSDAIAVKAQVMSKLLQFSEALVKGDYSKRIITDFDDTVISEVVANFNQFADQLQLNADGHANSQEETINTFIEVISSYTNLDFSRRLPISEHGTVMDAIATGINMLGDELAQTAASKYELELERNRLREAKEIAEEASKAKSSFLANMSHEIRTPLNGILGLTRIIMMESQNEEHRKYLEMVINSGENLSQLINDILDLSRIESGKLELECIDFNLARVLTNEVEKLRFKADEKGLKLSLTLDPKIPDVLAGDPTRIAQLIINLVNNAIKFTEVGSVSVCASLIEESNEEAHLSIAVRDTGIGITASQQKQIFESFSQADNSVTRKYGGTGLGLAIVKNLVEQMGGTIQVSSLGIGGGSIFTLLLKLKVPAKSLVNNDTSLTTPQFMFDQPFKILIVDDNPINLLVATKMVERFGGLVTTAQDGQEAIEKIQGIEFDAVLMDIQMPVLDGHAATRQLRALHFYKPIIALSANAFPQDIQNSLSAGMNDHLHKPFTERQLFHTICKFVA